ncbi:unnamed protein product [Rhodiola kirilowii]
MDLICFPSRFVVVALSAAIISLVLPIYGQQTTMCTPTMLTGFTPCMNYLNGIVRNRTLTVPPPDCCTSVKTLAANGSDCYCQLVTGRSPFQFQINQTLAVSLARACNTPKIAFQCQAAASAPIPAPGPGAFAGLLSPTPAEAPPPVLAPSDSSSPPTASTETPASSASSLQCLSSPTHLFIVFGALVMMYLYH